MKKEEFNKIKWGDIYYCNLGNTNGSVQSGRRPVMVVQTNKLNKHSPTVVVASITAVKKKTDMESHIILDTSCGLKEKSMLLLEQLRTVDKAEELEDYIGSVTDDEKIDEIKRGLKYTVGIPMKPKAERKGMILTLCPRCRSEFFSVPENILRRVDPLQTERDVCDKCQVRYGYDYLIMKKYNHNTQGRAE